MAGLFFPASVVALVLICALFSPVPGVASVKREAGIAGQIVLRREGEKFLAHHLVELAIFRHGVLAGRKKVETDVSGRFRFVPVKTENGLSYQVTTSYENVSYKSPPSLFRKRGSFLPFGWKALRVRPRSPNCWWSANIWW